jgi:hypothetical protein
MYTLLNNCYNLCGKIPVAPDPILQDVDDLFGAKTHGQDVPMAERLQGLIRVSKQMRSAL